MTVTAPTNVPQTKPTVIITGADRPTGLTTARALRKLPIFRIGIVQSKSTDCASSNCWDELIVVDSEDADIQLSAIIQASKDGRIPKGALLLFAQDDLVTAASKRLGELRETLVVPLPQPEVVELLMDKTQFHSWASEHGLPVPRSFVVSSVEETKSLLECMTFPCILKPLCRTPVWENTFKNTKLFYFATEAELLDALNNKPFFTVMDRFLLQEWIEGDDSDVYFSLLSADPKGNILSQFTGQKLWQWPPLEGSTALCCSSDETEVADIARRIYTELDWTGLASVEFKRDRRTGRYLIVEPTIGRNNHQSAIALAGGCNPTAAMVGAYLGIPYFERPQQKGKRCYWFDEKFILYRLEQEKNWGDLMKLIKEICFKPRIYVRFNLTDPHPFAKFLQWLSQRLVKIALRRSRLTTE